MNYWMYNTPAGNSSIPIWTIYSEEAIIASYYDSWRKHMIEHNVDNDLDLYQDISVENCIEDWVSVHWAVPVDAEYMLPILRAPKVKNNGL